MYHEKTDFFIANAGALVFGPDDMLYIADVGQNDIEEINLGEAGGNFGWNVKEATFCFDPNGEEPGFAYECTAEDDTEGLIDPIAEYSHAEGVAVVGGFVYRGAAVPDLQGRYVFGDFLLPEAMTGRLFHLGEANEILEFDLDGQEALGLNLLGFGQDADGELYVMANATGTPFGETGVVLRIAQAPDDGDGGDDSVLDIRRAFTARPPA